MTIKEFLKVLYPYKTYQITILNYNNIEEFKGTIKEFLKSNTDYLIDFVDIYSEKDIIIWI